MLLVFTPDERRADAISAAGLLVFWTCLATGSAILNWLVFRRADGEQLERWLVATTPLALWRRVAWAINGGGAISWAIAGSGIAIAAVVFLTQREEFRTDPVVVWPAIAAVASPIIMTASAYAVRYPRANATDGGIKFTGTEHPRFIDYFYLAVQVSTTFSTSDVAISTSKMRRTVSTHSLSAFTFNTVIVALLVSLLISSVS